jgi:hypothetical protein
MRETLSDYFLERNIRIFKKTTFHLLECVIVDAFLFETTKKLVNYLDEEK